ncbi:MAG TPA: YlbF family regulator [Bacilli bacterium]|nr:YlbF family regulator [Bacilli bacterium]
MNPYDKAHELARALRESSEYKALLEQKGRVDQDPVAKKMLDDFRHRQWELETRRIMGEEITDTDREQMEKLAQAVQLNAVLSEYLQAEYRFGIVYSDVHKILGDAVKEVVGQPEASL